MKNVKNHREQAKKDQKSVVNKLNTIDVSEISITKQKWLAIKQFSIKKKKNFYNYKQVYNTQRAIYPNSITILI